LILLENASGLEILAGETYIRRGAEHSNFLDSCTADWARLAYHVLTHEPVVTTGMVEQVDFELAAAQVDSLTGDIPDSVVQL